MLVALLVAISTGASLSVWKDAERKVALFKWRRVCVFWGKGRGGGKKGMKFDWQGVGE